MIGKRNAGFDCLRATACLFIILLHTTYSTVLMYAGEMTFWRAAVGAMVQHNLMWAVPCFIMVTGALLLPPEKRITYSALFKKYIARMMKAIVLFGVLFVVLEMIFNPSQRTGAHFLNGLYEVFAGDSWSHMWYLYCLLGLYLLMPLYKKVSELAGERDMLYLMGIYTLFLSVVPCLQAVGVRCGFYVHVSSIYPLYLFMGYWLKRWGMKYRRAWYGAAFLAATAAIAALSYVRVRWGVAQLDVLFEYNSPLVIVQALGIAGWFFHMSDEPSAVKTVLANIDRHSFGVYLIHMAYVRLLFKHLHFDPFHYGGMAGVLLTAAIAFGAAYVTDLVMKRIPVVKDVV